MGTAARPVGVRVGRRLMSEKWDGRRGEPVPVKAKRPSATQRPANSAQRRWVAAKGVKSRMLAATAVVIDPRLAGRRGADGNPRDAAMLKPNLPTARPPKFRMGGRSLAGPGAHMRDTGSDAARPPIGHLRARTP